MGINQQNIYFGTNAIGEFRDYLTNNFKYKKLLVYGNNSMLENFENIIIVKLNNLNHKICSLDIAGLIVVGGNPEVNDAISFAIKHNLVLIYYITSIINMNNLLGLSNFADSVTVAKVFIDEEKVRQSTSHSVTICCFSVLDKLYYIIISFVYGLIYSERFPQGVSKQCRQTIKNVFVLVNSLSVLNEEGICKLIDEQINLTELCGKVEYDIRNDIGYVWNTLCETNDVLDEEIKQCIGNNVFLNCVNFFLLNFQNFNSYIMDHSLKRESASKLYRIDISSRLYFDEQIAKNKFIIEKSLGYRYNVSQLCDAMNILTKSIIGILGDKGYELSRHIDVNEVLVATSFLPEFVPKNKLLQTMKSLGAFCFVE